MAQGGFLQEFWKRHPTHPDYLISLEGDIRLEPLGEGRSTPINVSYTKEGAPKVNIRANNGSGHITRSLKLLVAETWVEPLNEMHDSVINLNGDPQDCRPSNLAWRPRWFVWKYTHQFVQTEVPNIGPVTDIGTEYQYVDLYTLCQTEGLLYEHVYMSIASGGQVSVFPFSHYYRV